MVERETIGEGERVSGAAVGPDRAVGCGPDLGAVETAAVVLRELQVGGARGSPRQLAMMRLQQTVGNRATTGLLQRSGAWPAASRAPRMIVQRAPRKQSIYIPYQVMVSKPMNQEQFKQEASLQIFGRVLPNINWRNLRSSYDKDKSPYRVSVDADLVRAVRGQARRERGLAVGPEGDIADAADRAEAFQRDPESEDKAALMDEIDRRYYMAIRDTRHRKIRAGEKGQAELWKLIRDEVLFQHDYFRHLPPDVEDLLLSAMPRGDIRPEDYDRAFALAQKIQHLPAGELSDYLSKNTDVTPDMASLETSLDRYIAVMAERGREDERRGGLKRKLIGLDALYDKYRQYKDLMSSAGMSSAAATVPGGGGGGIVLTREAMKLRAEIDGEVRRYGFPKGITEFEETIKAFERAFEGAAATIATDLLAKYSATLVRESRRYTDQSEVAMVHGRLATYRAHYSEMVSNATIWNEYVRDVNASRVPGQWHIHPKVSPDEADAALKRAKEAQAVLPADIKALAHEYPIFEEEALPVDRRIDKASLGTASVTQLQGILQAHIQKRMTAVDAARADIEDKPELIYKMDKLMPTFYAAQGIKPGSIHDKIIQDKLHEDAIVKLVIGIAFAIVAVALAVVTFGAATPAIVAAGAGVLGAGLGVYMAVDEYEQYVQSKHLADVGLSDDPSTVWLVLAIVGAGLDVASAAKAVAALRPAAKLLSQGGDLAAFTKTVQELEQQSRIEAKAARAAENAAKAREGLKEATAEFQKALGKAYSLPGPFTDPEVYRALVKMARQYIKAKAYDLEKFIEDLRLARVNAKLGELTPEELEKAKQAWEEAKAFEEAEKARYERLLIQVGDAKMLDSLIAQAGSSERLERLLQVFSQQELETIFAAMGDTSQLATIAEHIGGETTRGAVREWMAAGKTGHLNDFAARLASGVGKELAEQSALSAKSLILDSNTAISLEQVALGKGNKAHAARAAYIGSLPADTDLRIANAAVGEVGSGVINAKGLPIVVSRESAEYQKLLAVLDKQKIGAQTAFRDRGLIADAFFAKTEAGVVPRLLSTDRQAVNGLARLAGFDLNTFGGYPKLLERFGQTGFDVTVGGRTLKVIPGPL
ncbi:MAG: hypothetical protein ACJ780_17845 [Solirubrobacteraceae bacterium]